MKKFEKWTDIPDFPACETPEEHQKYCKQFIETGALPKSALVSGNYYLGNCRNSHVAYWDGSKFRYFRTKWGSSYSESINHFEDDNGADLFVPLEIIL